VPDRVFRVGMLHWLQQCLVAFLRRQKEVEDEHVWFSTITFWSMGHAEAMPSSRISRSWWTAV